MLGDHLLVWLRVLQPTEILSIQLREPEAVSVGDDAVEDRPAEAEAAGRPSGRSPGLTNGVPSLAQESVRVPGEADHSLRWAQ